MSEVKTNEPVKQEGEFKLKTKKKTPKKLNQTEDNVTKVNVNPKEPLIELEPEVKKVVIPKQEENAVQAQETNDSNVVVEESKDSSNSEGVVEEVRTTEEKVEEFNSFLEESAGNILDLAYAAVENENKTLHLNASLLSSYTQEYFARHKEFLSSAKAFLRESALNTVSSLRHSLSRAEQDIPFYCRSIIALAKDKLDNFRDAVSILDPKNILKISAPVKTAIVTRVPAINAPITFAIINLFNLNPNK